jgi:protease YdgD
MIWPVKRVSKHGKSLSGLSFSALLGAAVLSWNSADAAPLAPFHASPQAHALLQRVAVFGQDDRKPLPQSYWKTGARIGVLHDPQSRSVCTAFCVGEDIIATAAHCLYRTGEEKPLRLDDVTFQLNGSKQPAHVAGTDEGAAEANVISGSTHLSVKPPIDAAHDWAFIRTAEPVCKAGYFKISRRSVADVMQLARHGHVYNVAYHRDVPNWEPMLGRHCRVDRNFKDADWDTIRKDFDSPRELLLHTCDTGGASSGSPLLADGPDGPEVVGINVGTYIQSKVIMLNGEVVHRFHSDDVANTGVNSLAFASAFDAFVSADLLVTRRDVRRLQAALKQRGFYDGANDGRYGPATKLAVERFERAAAMPVTGLATSRVLQALLGESTVVTGHVGTQGKAEASKKRPGR